MGDPVVSKGRGKADVALARRWWGQARRERQQAVPSRSHGRTYELTRPEYSPEIVAYLLDVLGIGARSTVLDLAAGTGKLTRALAASGASVVAVEPLPRMYLQIPATVPSASVVAARAESLPLAPGSMDAVTVSQAFQWFNTAVALPEIHRVLRPEGAFGVIGYRFDRSVPWVAQLSMTMNRYKRNPRRRRASQLGRAWLRAANFVPGLTPRLPGDSRSPVPEVMSASPLFVPLGQRHFRQEHEMDMDTLLERVTRATMSEQDRAKAEEAVRQIVGGFPSRFGLPYEVRFYWYRRTEGLRNGHRPDATTIRRRC
ncbi:MAG TPA: class I SAM-dependent methyltransferase [Acidimicrobiales bacterium]|nr:class I SAM-dependent methyltransferase [Acidimicrobiales bacterium]